MEQKEKEWCMRCDVTFFFCQGQSFADRQSAVWFDWNAKCRKQSQIFLLGTMSLFMNIAYFFIAYSPLLSCLCICTHSSFISALLMFLLQVNTSVHFLPMPNPFFKCTVLGNKYCIPNKNSPTVNTIAVPFWM